MTPLINHVSVRELKPNGSLKANIRLGGILVGTYRRRVTEWGQENYFLPGGTMYEVEEGVWRITEPITVLENGQFVNHLVKQEIDELCDVWWMRHRLKQEIDPADEPVTRFVDRPWTKDVVAFVRPVKYTSPEEAIKSNRPWDAGRAELVIRKEDLEMIVKIPIRRRATGVEASLPKWRIVKPDLDPLGRTVERVEYVPKFRFQAGGGYIDSQILGAITLIWAWRFDVKEPFVTRKGTCSSCRHLAYRPEEKALTDKDDPVGRKWFCTLFGRYIDEGAASSEEVKRLYWSGQERLAAREAGLARFSYGCEQWESNGLAGLTSLKVYTEEGVGLHYEDFVMDGQLTEEVRNLDDLTIRFEAPGFDDPEDPGAHVPSVSVWVRPLIEDATSQETEERGRTPQAPRTNSSANATDVPF